MQLSSASKDSILPLQYLDKHPFQKLFFRRKNRQAFDHETYIGLQALF